MQKYLLTCLFGLHVYLSFSQIKSEHRIESEFDKDVVEFFMIPMDEYGALKLSYREREKGRGKVLALSELNTQLQEDGFREYELDENMVYKNHHVQPPFLTILFKRKNKGNFFIYRYKMGKGLVNEIEGTMHPKSIIDEFVNNEKMALIGAHVKRESMLIKVNFASGKQNIIPFQKEQSAGYPGISEMFLSDNNDLINVVLVKNKKQNPYVVLNRYNELDVQEEINVKVKDKSILSAAVTDIDEGKSIVSGTYGLYGKMESTGMYISGIDGGKQSFINYYPFSDFDMAFEHLRDSKRNKLEKKKQRKDEKRKELNLSFSITLHEIQVINNEYVVIAECYYPTYRTEMRQVTDPQTGMVRMEHDIVFDGYQYSHAIVAGFDNAGNKLWDQTLEMWQAYKVFKPKRFIQASVHDDVLKLLFVSQGKIVTKQIKAGVQLKEGNVEISLPGQLTEELKYNRNNQIAYWYDAYFLAWGEQKIINNSDKSKDRKRKVFFVEKWKFN